MPGKRLPSDRGERGRRRGQGGDRAELAGSSEPPEDLSERGAMEGS